MGLGDMAGMFGKVQEMQAKMKTMQEEMAKKTVQASSGGGMVTATVNGKSELLDIKIDTTVVDINDLEMLEDLIKAAVNAAMAKSQQLLQEEMGKLTGGLNIPGMDQLSKMFG
jgi:DNA-binding YbaB/EbfC family protein